MPSTAFTAVLLNVANDRHFGGSAPNVAADPYISGYHYIRFTKLPIGLANAIRVGHASPTVGGEEMIKVMLSGACLSVTPPGGTLNKTEFTGIGGLKWAVPTNMDYGTSVTVKFLEFSHLPIMSIISGWFRSIRDTKTGTSAYGGILAGGPEGYTKSAYTGTMFYWTTKPDGTTVEYSACYTGMFPLKDPHDLFTGDLTAVDKLEIDIEFNVDWIWRETWVHNICQNYANIIKNSPKSGYRGTDSIRQLGTDNIQ